MSDLTGQNFSQIFPKLLQDPGDGTIQKSDGTEGASGKLSKSEFTSITAKTDFTDTDSFLRTDSVSGLLRKFTWANLKTAILDFLGFETGDWDIEYSTTGVPFDAVTYTTARRSSYWKILGLYVIYGRIATLSITKGSATGLVLMSLPFVSAAGTGQTSGGIVFVRKTGFVTFPTVASIEDAGTHAVIRKGTDVETQILSVDDLDYTGTGKNVIQFIGLYL